MTPVESSKNHALPEEQRDEPPYHQRLSRNEKPYRVPWKEGQDARAARDGRVARWQDFACPEVQRQGPQATAYTQPDAQIEERVKEEAQ